MIRLTRHRLVDRVRPCRRHSFTLAIRRASRPRAGALRRRQPRAHRPPAQRWAPAVSGSRGIGQRATASRGALAAPRTAAADGSPRRQRGTLECAQRAIQRRRPARLRPTAPRRCGSCAAALVTTTTVACQVVGSRARYHRVQTATMAGRGAKAGTARRARGGGRAHPAIRHRVCIRTRSGVRRLTILVPIGAAFGHGTRTHTLSRTLTGREASKCAVRPQSAARAEHLSRAPGEQSTTTGTPPRCRFSFRRLCPCSPGFP